MKKAVVLAAGFGTRLRPFTATVPKPLLPVWGEPMLSRIVSMLRGWGVGEIAVNAHHLAGEVVRWAEANGCRASVENEILGSGGALNPLRDWLGDEPFFLVNGDIVVEGIDRNPFPADALEPRLAGTGTVAAALVTEEGPRTIETESSSSLVTCWKSPSPGARGTYTYSGIALLSPRILDYVPKEGFSSIVDAYEKAAESSMFVRAVEPPDMRWADAGTVESYVDLNTAGGECALGALPQLVAVFGSERDVEFLGARGSDRCFFRADDGIAVVYDDSKRGENARYASHARFLASKGIKVPAVVADAPDMKCVVLENAGEEDLSAAARRLGTIAAYSPVVEELVRFNSVDPVSAPEMEEPFGPDLWKWERGLFAEHCLGGRYARSMPRTVEDELVRAAAVLDAEPPALVHRDFQSTNVVWRGGDFRIIDFQGMRIGPAVYDLASLLYDPYVELKESERHALAELYAARSGRREILKALPFAAVERLVQALGAYGRLAAAGRREFSKFVAPALSNLLEAADEAGLEAVGALAEDLIAAENHE
ncbi:MAG: phosphotransferase [Kiritimatiellae bacterium]|nr:phosphotransferase [Kiritimatiellia bacterium]